MTRPLPQQPIAPILALADPCRSTPSRAYPIAAIALALVFAAALLARVRHLETMPGLNGDEAWYGVQAASLLHGRPVAWWTPSGLPLNPFFAGPEVAMLAVFEPRFWLLRAPAVASGVLAVLAAFVLGRRALDPATALIAAMLLAVLPVAIGYSRFGWDASQTPLFGVLTLCAAIRGRGLLTTLAFAAGVLVHPTNVFLFPAAALCLAPAVWRRHADRPGLRRKILVACACAGLLMAAVFCWRLPLLGTSSLVDRLAFGPLLRYFTHLGRLISGVSLYEYVVGPVPAALVRAYDLAFWTAVLALLAFGIPRLRATRDWSRLGLVAGVPAGAVVQYLVAGSESIAPHYERYGLFLVAPTVLALACLIRALLPEVVSRDPLRHREFALALAISGAFSLVGFERLYFEPLRRTGGESHRTFRTALREPKQAAFAGILAELARLGPHPGARIIAEDWWLYQPLSYLASARPGLEVAWAETVPRDPVFRQRYWRDQLAAGSYLVGFIGGPLETEARAAAPDASLERTMLADRAGRPLLVVLRDRGAVLARARSDARPLR